MYIVQEIQTRHENFARRSTRKVSKTGRKLCTFARLDTKREDINAFALRHGHVNGTETINWTLVTR